MYLKNPAAYDEIMKSFYCYVEGVFNYNEFFDLVTQFFEKPNDEYIN